MKALLRLAALTADPQARKVSLLRNGPSLDPEVYGAAAWTSIGLLSGVSVTNRLQSVDAPDVTARH
jgi:hypothetical protein